ncbi:MAG TPA: carbohydrate kinase family protein [archaeon]|nr:carbohydrate kinase family protein [archaeon]
MKVFAVGDLCLDVLCSIREHASLGEEKHIYNLNFSLGGNAANFSFAAAELGFDVELLSAIGKDFASDFLKKQLNSAGVKARLQEFPSMNSFSILLVNPDGQKSTYSSKGALENLTAEHVEKELLPRLKQGDLVFFGGYFHMYGLHKGFLRLLKKIREKNCTVAFDLCFDEFQKWRILEFLPLIDFLFLNDLELQRLTKKSNEKAAISFLLEKGATKIVLKKGPKGSAFFAKKISCHAKAVKAPAVDTTGAGDIFNAAFLKAFFEDLNCKKCLEFANFAASRKISRHGLFLPERSILNKKILYLQKQRNK